MLFSNRSISLTTYLLVLTTSKAWSGIEGVENVKVDLAKGEATFDEAGPVDRAVIAERLRKAGFDIA